MQLTDYNLNYTVGARLSDLMRRKGRRHTVIYRYKYSVDVLTIQLKAHILHINYLIHFF